MTHPDQRYTVRNLQHADLLAEADRERRIREAEGVDGEKRTTRMWFGAGRWVAGAAGALGAIMIALSILIPWGGPARPARRPQASHAAGSLPTRCCTGPR